MLRKHHWMLHLSSHLELWKFLPNCWSLERTHKTVMMFATQGKKTTGYGLHLLEECICHDLHNLQHSDHLQQGVQLLNRHKPSAKFHAFLCDAIFQQQVPKEQVWTAISAKLALGGSIYNQDFILVKSNNAYKWQIARMEHHFEVQNVVYSIVTFCTCIECSFATHSAQVQIQEQLQLIETGSILCPLIFAEEQRAIRVLIPWAYRPPKA